MDLVLRNRSLRLAAAAAVALFALLIPSGAQPAHAAIHAAAQASLPSDRLHFGLANSPGPDFDWMVGTGIPWRYRYQYLAGGINTGGAPGDPCGANAGWQTWNSPAGQFVTDYITASAAHSYIPVFSYYEIVQSNPSPGNESAELTKISTTCTMQAYWADFTVLMQKVGAAGGQVVVHVEPDFWGFMQQKSADPTTIPAVVASSGNPDLAGLPNTLQGMALAFLKLRDKYAPNALLAIHLSNWQSGRDISTDHDATLDPSALADSVVAFANKAGLVGNPSGVTPWDVIFNDVADHDAAWYGPATNDHWWDRNNAVFPNFTRWLAYVHRMHTDTGLPIVAWQVPVGNQYFQTMNNTDGHYQDNRAEYFLAHPDQLSAAGIVAVMFGKANSGQTNYWDEKADGITNPAPVSSWQCNLCNNHVSTVADDDGGFLRMAVGQYYSVAPPAPCTKPAFSAAPPSQQATGGAVTFNASTSGCPSPRYRFWIRPPGGPWTIKQDYGPTSSFTWNDTGLAGAYGVEVDVRDASESVSYDAVTNLTYQLNGCSAVSLGANPTSPQPPSGSVLLTASATCPGTPIYRFWVQAPGGPWTIKQDYTTANTYSWPIAGRALGSYRLEVDVKNQGGTDTYEKVNNLTFSLGAAACATPTLSANPASPGATGATIAFTSSTSGCATPLYRFWVSVPGGPWVVMQDYSPTNTFAWSGTGLAGSYRIEVDVREQAEGNSVTYDAVKNLTYALSGCSAVTLTSSPLNTAAHGSTVTLTATATCPGTPTYKFWIRAPGGSWTVVRAYALSNTFTWTSSSSPISTGTPGTYSLEVDVEDQGGTDTYETVNNITYKLT
ncbi:MAG TPA: hypothetical protein VGU71_16070 [Candidatus Dormibacteraeota bacterium]|nr:hypothetical protein [Candidatus Dormibacteraeota bacterium]